MPGRRNANLKDPELYEKVRKSGASKEKAARVSNAAAGQGRSRVGKKGGSSPSYEDWKVPDLKKRAKELGLSGYSDMRKGELISAIRDH